MTDKKPTPLRVYIAGSHSTGKTTLARWTARAYGLPLVTEVARSVLAERELSLVQLRTDLTRTAEFQREVFRRQAEAEDRCGARYVSDRAFDNLAYAASHTLAFSSIVDATTSLAYANRLKASGSFVFFIRPHKALLSQDGVREPAEWDEIVRIDGMIRLLLELHDVDYVSVYGASMAERARTIRAVLRGAGETPKEAP